MLETCSTREIVLNYFYSWQKQDWEAMRNCVTENYYADIGNIQLSSLDHVIEMCKNGVYMEKLELLESLFLNDKASLLYEGKMSGGQRVRVAEFFYIQNGKISISKAAISFY